MLGAVMVHVAALAEGREVRVGVVSRVVIAVRCRQHDLRRTNNIKILDRRQGLERSALPIAPSTDAGVPPVPVAEMVDGLPMRPTTTFTSAPCSAEADRR